MEIPLAVEGLEKSEIDAVCEVFRSGKHTMGEHVARFEDSFAKHLGIKHAVMVNSGSSANLLALEAIVRGSNSYLPENAIIAVPAILWPTSLWPIIQLGFKVLLVDTLPNSLQIDFDELIKARKKYGKKLVGAILIHPLGSVLPLDRVRELREVHDMFVIEDTCESLGAGNNDQYAGTVGNFGTFSFYFSHHITTVEGGMVVTNDEQYANDLKSMRAHGWTRNRTDASDWIESNPDTSKDFLFVTSGYNFRPMEFQGVLGQSQLKKLKGFVERRIQIATKVNDAMQNTKLKLIGFDSNGNKARIVGEEIPSHSWMALPISIDPNFGRSSEIQFALASRGIHTRPILAGNFARQPAGKNKNIKIFGNLINSERTYETGFMVGNHHAYTDEQVDYMCDVLRNIKL